MLREAFADGRKRTAQKADGDEKLEDQRKAAIKAKPPNSSARSIAERLVEVVPRRGTMATSDEPKDDKLEDEE